MKYLLFSLLFFCLACSASKSDAYQDSSEKMEKQNPYANANSLADALSKVSGIRIMGSGNRTTIRIRSMDNSFNLSSEPLFVVDGNIESGGFNSLNRTLNVRTIKSIDVLKDANSTAGYGSRGANGVIVIRTGKEN